tara:strand:+ start:385 stop:987 length:603 start_codon:yes stop_codon:yes gene_type:complete
MVQTFNKFEKAILLAVAEGRTKSKSKEQNRRMAKCPEWAKVTGDHDIDLDFWGIAGEMAVAKHLNICPDLSISKAGDGGKTDLIRNNKTIQVKTNFFQGEPVLIFNQTGRNYTFKTDYAVLVSVVQDVPDSIKILGMVSQKSYQSRKRKDSPWYEHDFGYGMRDCIAAKDLTQLKPSKYYYAQVFATAKEIKSREGLSKL